MTTKHTPAPWAVYGPAHLIVSAAVGSPVVAETVRESAQENAANAAHIVRCVNERDALIAQRDELVAALRDALLVTRDIENRERVDDATLMAGIAAAKLEAALAKAEGAK